MTNTSKKTLEEYGIRPSYTRLKIYSYLKDSEDHPTVDMIYQDLVDKLPTLSKTTVYNVLSLFMDQKLVKSVNTSASEMRFELAHLPHSHFKCDTCGVIYDIPMIKVNYDEKQLQGFAIKEEEVLLIGTCPNCRAKNKNKR